MRVGPVTGGATLFGLRGRGGWVVLIFFGGGGGREGDAGGGERGRLLLGEGGGGEARAFPLLAVEVGGGFL